ncbi:MAG: sugar phosphate isomerase/epimerase, partial [Planctomycetes bacterium]|nr:sugar phosphate isomerase/epimerase [Planctomycetota bacterium]
MPTPVSRRTALAAAALAAAPLASPVAAAPAARRGRIRQSIVYWCFNVAGGTWDIERMCAVAKDLGCQSIELAPPETWATIKKHGLTSAIVPNGMPGAPFMRGLNNPAFHDQVIARTTEMINAAADAGFPAVIAFTGYKWRNPEDPSSGEIPAAEGADHCVKALRALAGHAEKKGVTICLEHLNTRDGSHPMKGHPGYQGDDIDAVADIVRRVGSERVKVLFDIYHVQIMHGDVIRRIEQCKDVIGHVHTA